MAVMLGKNYGLKAAGEARTRRYFFFLRFMEGVVVMSSRSPSACFFVLSPMCV